MSRGDPWAEITLIRHAPARSEGRLCGRRDVPCDLPDTRELAEVGRAVGDVDRVFSSPARRCQQTATALWPSRDIAAEPQLWEQDFGNWEGLPFAELPDLGALSQVALAAYRPPGGESFDDVVARVVPVLEALRGSVALVVHAGVIRAALSQVVGGPATVGFVIDPLSVTRLTRHGRDAWAAAFTNWRPK